MRKQQFVNFLKDYLQDISGLKTCNIHKLAKEMKKNYRIRDSLILYCALSGDSRRALLNRFTNNKYKEVMNNLNRDNFLNDEFKEYEFRKIWNSYQNKIKVVEYDNYIKENARLTILKSMKEKGITNYRVYKDLNLNPGNINDYLTNNNVKKVSVATVKAIANYVYTY